MNARLSKFALTTSLLACTALACLLFAGQALSPSSALAETPPPPPGIPSLPEPPADPSAAPAPEAAVPAPTAPPVSPSTSTPAPAPAETAPARAKKKRPAKRAHCRGRKHCGRHASKRGRPGGATTSAVVGGVEAGAVAYFSTCYHAVYGVAYNMSSLQSSGVWALPMMYDWATSRWTWPRSWTPADGVTNWALTAYNPYGYVYMWYARYANGDWRYAPEWVYVEPDLDNGFC